MRKKLIGLAVVAVLALSLLPATAMAVNPTVSITVYATMISITNSHDTWAIGYVQVDAVKYFSATGAQDDDYSLITNTGNQHVDVEIQGTNFEGGAYDWTLAGTAGNRTYSLYANQAGTPTVYDVEVESSGYHDIVANLGEGLTNAWSMKFTAPNEFDPADTGLVKSATVTLVATLTV
jgi:hypothetical protein